MRALRAAAGPEAEAVGLGLYDPLSETGHPFDAVGDTALGLYVRLIVAGRRGGNGLLVLARRRLVRTR